MRPSKFTDSQIVQALRRVQGGTPAVQVCRELGVTETTFYRWRGKFGGIAAHEGHEVRALRDENHKLKEIVANLMLEKERAATFRGKKL